VSLQIVEKFSASVALCYALFPSRIRFLTLELVLHSALYSGRPTSEGSYGDFPSEPVFLKDLWGEDGFSQPGKVSDKFDYLQG